MNSFRAYRNSLLINNGLAFTYPFRRPILRSFLSYRKFNSKKSYFIYFVNLLKSLFLKKITINDNRPVVVIHTYWSSGYFHWIFDSLYNYYAFTINCNEPHLVILPVNYPKFAKESLVDFSNGEIVEILPNATYRICGVAYYFEYSGNYQYKFNTDLFQGYINKFQFLHNTKEFPKSRIYISRPSGISRSITNENQLVKHLREWGFEIVNLEDKTIAEQIKIFRSASVVIAAHGAALSNMIHMTPNSKIVELYPKMNTSANPLYEDLAMCCNLRYSRRCLESVGNKGDIHNVRMYFTELNLDELKSCIFS